MTDQRNQGGDASDATRDDLWAWWPRKVYLGKRTVPVREPAWAVSTSYVRPDPLALDDESCDWLIALGRERGLPGSLAGVLRAHEADVTGEVGDQLRERLMSAVTAANETWWRLDVAHWRILLKRYEIHQGHSRHVDLVPGIATRKLSASVQLSSSDDYAGGDLLVTCPGICAECRNVPRDRGTITVYPAWTTHQVQNVKSGERWALVMHGWGPPLR